MYKYLIVLCVVYSVTARDLYTEDSPEYKFFPVSNTSVHFKVKAANDAHIALATGTQHSDQIIEVVIGGWSNTNSVIRRLKKTLPHKVTVETPGILSVSVFRGFWVSWDGGVIKVGREGADTPFMSWADPNPFHVAYVGVHTGWGATGSWVIEESPYVPVTAPSPSSAPDDVIVSCKGYLNTEDNFEYKFFPVSNMNTSVHFKVKAANDAYIALTTGPQQSDRIVEVIIGGWSNTKSVLRRLNSTIPDKVTAETPGILNRGEFRGFWVSWDGGVISVGREGTDAPFMSWEDSHTYPVAFVGVHTGFGATGSWLIEDLHSASVNESPPSSAPEDVVIRCTGYLNTEDKVEYKFFPVSNTSIHFKVKASNDAHIAFTSGFQESDPMVEIVIGGWRNTNSVIRRLYRTVPDKITAETPDILSACELRGFWVSWNGGVISVGREDADAPFMTWADPNPFPVAFVGVHTGFGATGSWIIEVPSAAPDAA